jgi:hypothetical protein
MRRKDYFSQSGQSIVELIILWPTLILLTLGTLQMAFLYRDKAVFNDAVFRAAREGALNHAYVNTMNKKLVEGLIPLYQKRAPTEAAYGDAFISAFRDNGIDPVSGNIIGLRASIKIDLIAPNRAIFSAFRVPMFELVEGCEDSIETVSRGNNRTSCARRGEVLFTQIPNDNLHIRAKATSSVVMNGENVRINLQDANLLKINAHWCAPLSVPFGRFALYQWDRTWSWIYANLGGAEHPHWPVCRAKTAANAEASARGEATRIMYIPISSDAIVRMQSPIRCQGDERNGNPARCRNLE